MLRHDPFFVYFVIWLAIGYIGGPEFRKRLLDALSTPKPAASSNAPTSKTIGPIHEKPPPVGGKRIGGTGVPTTSVGVIVGVLSGVWVGISV